MNEHQQLVQQVYGWAISNGIVSTKVQFADELGIDRTTLVSVLKGRFSGKIVAKKAVMWMEVKEKELQGKAAPLNNLVYEIPTLPTATTEFSLRARTTKDILCSVLSNSNVKPLFMSPNELSGIIRDCVWMTNELFKKLNDEQQ